MFIGHFGLGFASKKITRKPSLGTLFLAVQLLDLLWPIFLLLGWEKVRIVPQNPPLLALDFTYYPYSHSLVFALGWSVLFGGIYYLLRRDGRTALLLGFLVLSHWILDFFVHIPDLQLGPWSDFRVGLGLWNAAGWTVLVEYLIFLGGLFLYLQSTRAKNWVGHVSLWSLVLLLAGFYASSFFSPPPSSAQAIGWMCLIMWLLIPWGYWIDRTRLPV